jgi:hypothetical protein
MRRATASPPVPHDEDRHDGADARCGGDVRGGFYCAAGARLVRNEKDIGRTLRAGRVRLEHEDQQIRHDGERVAARDDQAVGARQQPARGIGEDDMDERRQHERLARKPDRRDESVVRGSQETERPREAHREEQSAGVVLGPPRPRDQARYGK